MYEFICPECGYEFDTPHEYDERHGFTHGPFEKWSVCPNCGQPGYERTIRCDRCGKIVPESDIIRSNIHGVVIALCENCDEELEDEQWK